MILSDISVHREQGNCDCVYFEKNDEEMLAEIIADRFEKTKEYDFAKGNRTLSETSAQYATELERVFETIGKRVEEKYVERLQKYRKDKILKLFGGMDSNHIGIYGTGWHTDKIMQFCELFLPDTDFVFFDSDSEKWGKKYLGRKIYGIESVDELGIRRIVISSIKYQEEIFDALQKYADKIEIVKIYETEDEKQKKLFW